MAVEGLKKHAGQLSNTGVRVAVVFRKLPNDENHCLIVETERLPDSYHDALIQCLNSREASETNDFYEVLNRRTFPDGLNCLTALHQRGYLRKEVISNVTMLPLPGHAVPLTLINAAIDKKLDSYDEKGSTTPTVEDPALIDPTAVAKGLIAQAEALEVEAKSKLSEAAAKKAEAYELAPELKPGVGPKAAPADVREARLLERKQRRLERDRKNAAEAKAAAPQKAIEAKVAAKIKRDQARVRAEAKAAKESTKGSADSAKSE